MRAIHKLSDRKVRTVAEGMHGDGGGLLLQVTRGTTGQLNRSWLFRFTSSGRERRMGLGAYPDIGLAAARARAADARKLAAQGIDPLAARDAQRAPQRVKVVTFAQAVDGFFNAHRAGWAVKHASVWRRSLDTHVTFARLPVDQIDTAVVMSCIGPLWASQPDLASRLRGRIERVLDWAKASGFRGGENPARWSDLRFLVPAVRRVHNVEHFAALPYADVGSFVGELRSLRGTAPRAFEFLILTATRTGEVLGMRWDELDGALWTIPGTRTKTRKEHRVPLSPAALAIIERQATVRENDFVFPGQRRHGLASTVLPGVLTRMGRSDITAHGFRSTFRSWAAETTDYPREVCEMALGHAIPSPVEAAYQRSDLFEKRRQLMNDWADQCSGACSKQ